MTNVLPKHAIHNFTELAKQSDSFMAKYKHENSVFYNFNVKKINKPTINNNPININKHNTNNNRYNY